MRNRAGGAVEMIEWIKSKLVPDAKQAWKWFSVQAAAIAAALPLAWPQLPSDFQNAIPGGLITAMSVVSLIAIVGRLVKQGDK